MGSRSIDLGTPVAEVREKRHSAIVTAWSGRPVPRAWKAYALALTALSAPFYIQGLVALPTAARGPLFTVPMFLLLIVANLCVLELPPYRFLHFMTGIIVFSGSSRTHRLATIKRRNIGTV